MTRRVCETCRFYQAAGFDNMGWCNHPRRKTGTDIRLFVRAAELNCRDDWEHDLWQEASTAGGDDVVVANQIGPLPAATADQVVSAASISRVATDDVMVHEAPGSTNIRPLGARSYLRKAKEEIRAQNRGVRLDTVPLPIPGPARGVDGAGEFAAAHPPGQGRIALDVPPVSTAEIGRAFPEMTSFPGDDDRFSSIPEVRQDVELPLAPARPRREIIRSSFDENQETQFAEAVFTAPPSLVAEFDAETRDAPGSPRRRSSDRFVPPLRRDNRVAAPEPVPAPRDTVSTSGVVETRREDIFLPDDDVLDDEPPVRVTPPRGRRSLSASEIRGESGVTPAIDAGLFPDADELLAPERLAPLLPAGSETTDFEAIVPLWANVPRECRTCKDFRPSEQADRGWCTNKFAFATRRMVEAGDCPCESSVGSWWIPNDDVWVSAIDVGRHATPTPLVDRMEAKRAAAARADDDLPLRRRQRS